MKIAITSTGPLSGKTTLANYLEAVYGFMYVNHSRTIAEHFVWWRNRYTNLPKISLDDVYDNKELYRPELQAFSIERGVSSPELADYWTDLTLKGWYGLHDEGANVVFEPFRGEVQAECMRGRGFLLVQLVISEDVRADRAGTRYERVWNSMLAHPDLERGIVRPDITLSGTLPVEKIARIVVKLAQERQAA